MADLNHLSIVVPVGPGDPAWRNLLNDLTAFGSAVEIILSACRPWPDQTRPPENVRWISGEPGRARQLNVGAGQASRPFVWFLHADTRCSERLVDAVRHFIGIDADSLGYFKLRFADDGPALTRLNARSANLRSRLFGLPFGDQGFIIHRRVFHDLKGFDEAISLGEDLDFVVRAKASGVPLRELPGTLETSARRYRQQGWLTTTLRHLWLTWYLTRQAKRRLPVVR